jgi:thioester reductase-like protein
MLPILVADLGRRWLSGHFDGLPVESIATAISTVGPNVEDGYETYHVMNPYDDGISMDTFADWLIDAGYPIIRVPGYAAWLERFETTQLLKLVPLTQKHGSLRGDRQQVRVASDAHPEPQAATSSIGLNSFRDLRQ